MKEITDLMFYRHDGFPDTDDAMTYAEAVAAHCSDGNDRAFKLDNWCRRVGAKLKPRQINRIIRATEPRRPTAAQLGRWLGLTSRERMALKITTFRACDVSPAEHKRRRKAQHRLRQQARRKAEGATPHEMSLSRTRPWEAEGISRRTWERRRKAVSQIRAQPTSLPAAHGPATRGVRGTPAPDHLAVARGTAAGTSADGATPTAVPLSRRRGAGGVRNGYGTTRDG
jgi:hypothetical protein